MKTKIQHFVVRQKQFPRQRKYTLNTKKKKRTEYVEHNIITHNAKIDHIGIEGLKGWKNKKVQFKDRKERDLEFVERKHGKTVKKWRRKNIRNRATSPRCSFIYLLPDQSISALHGTRGSGNNNIIIKNR